MGVADRLSQERAVSDKELLRDPGILGGYPHRYLLVVGGMTRSGSYPKLLEARGWALCSFAARELQMCAFVRRQTGP